MATIEQSVEVARPVSEVWDLWSDVRRLPELSKSTQAVIGAPDRLTERGQSFRQVVHAVGRHFDTTWRVVDIEACDHLTITGSPGFGTTLTLTEQVEPLEDTRTRCTLRIDYELPFGPVGRLASKLGIERLAGNEAGEVLDGLRRALDGSAAA